MKGMNWEQLYQEGSTHWDRGHPSPPLRQYLSDKELAGRVIVIGCGRGHDVAHLAERGVDVTGLDIAPTAIADAKARYPHLEDRFHVADLFDLPADFCGSFDVVVEHTCLSGLPPELRKSYRAGVDALLKEGGHVVGVWFINPDLDPGETGPPFPLPVSALDALFEDYEISDDYVPDAAFEGREGRERLRVLKKRPADSAVAK